MPNKPFTSQCTNVYNETTYNTIPHAFGLRNVTAMQAHDRTIYDTVRTCVAANFESQMQMPPSNYSGCHFNKPQVMYAQPQVAPRGVTFTFNPAPVHSPVPPCYNNFFCTGCPPSNSWQQIPQTHQQPWQQIPQIHQQSCQQSLTLQQQIALTQLQQQGLESILLQEQLKKNPYRLKFHYNNHTSTTDLLCGQSQAPSPGGMIELKNAFKALADLKEDIAKLNLNELTPEESPSNALYSEVYKLKRLLLTKSPDLLFKEKPNPCNSCITNENPECQEEKTKCSNNTGKETASTSKKNSRDDKKSKKQCKKSKKSEKKSTKTKPKRRHTKRESGNSSVDSNDSEEGYDDDYYSDEVTDDFDEDSDSNN